MSLNFQARESFFKSLNNLGILSALEITLASENRATKSASIDILLFIVDFSPSMVREYMLQQLNTTEEVRYHMIQSVDPIFKETFWSIPPINLISFLRIV